MWWIYLLLGLVIGLAVGVLGVVLWYRKGFSETREGLIEQEKESVQEAERRLSEALKTGERRKQELLLEAKEEIQRSKTSLEQTVQARRQEHNKERDRLEQKEEQLDRKQQSLEDQLANVAEKQAEVDRKLEETDRLLEERSYALERISELSMEEARKQVLDHAEKTFRHEQAQMLRQIEDETNEKADQIAREIVVTSIQRYASEYVAETTVSVVNLPSEEMKGRIIGREGRNIRAFETITGVDLIIDDTPEAVILSCFDPIRRETARIALEKLVQDGRIHPSRIEEVVDKSRKELATTIRKEGERAALETGVIGLDSQIILLLGRLKFRTSYGQNVLQHAIEVSKITGLLAAELDLDVQLAKRAGLLHDLGKSADFELEGSHVELGMDLAQKYREPDVVVNAIGSHHGDVDPSHPISILVAAADAISAARPGARRENLETYIKRLRRLEEIASSHEGVSKSYAIQAGREIRVIVEPSKVADNQLELTAREISRQIENELSYPGQIKISMIRETRATAYAK